jgi:hypothetical protein
VAIGNLNNDTLTDMLVGNYSGGMGLFYGKPDKIFGIGEPENYVFSTLRITPNPASDEVSIDIKSDFVIKPQNLAIHGIQGNIIRKYTQVEFPMLLDVSVLKNGIYLVVVQTNLGVASGKMVICR